MEAQAQLMRMYSLFIPLEILSSFEVVNVTEHSTNITIDLTEKESLVPPSLKGKEYSLNGFFNPLELQSFPVNAKECYLRLTRRRWKEKGNDGHSYYNEYDFAAAGTKATKSFGAFLKENF
jgi:hypothetical protein